MVPTKTLQFSTIVLGHSSARGPDCSPRIEPLFAALLVGAYTTSDDIRRIEELAKHWPEAARCDASQALTSRLARPVHHREGG
jgi:hypothetical protein